MILKLKNNGGWIFTDGNNISYQTNKVKDYIFEADIEINDRQMLQGAINQADSDSIKAQILISDTYLTEWFNVVKIDNDKIFITNQDFYILNEQGKTIEKVI